MGAARGWIVLLFLGLSLALPSVVQAQATLRPLDIRGMRELRFGDVLSGTSAAVRRDDAAHAGFYVIRGGREAEVVLVFSLPSNLVGPGGALLRIAFGPDDAGYRTPRDPQALGFDPQAPYINKLGRNGRAEVQLGGTVSAAFGQRAGLYRAPVTLTVAYTGN